MNAIYRISRKYLIFIVAGILLTSCNKSVEIGAPVTSVNEENVYTNDETSISVLNGNYGLMSLIGSIFNGSDDISLLCGLSADEWTLYSGVSDPTLLAYYQNALSSSNNSKGSEFWSPLYNFVYTSNAIIKGLNNSTTLTPSAKQQLLGEAKFLRGFYYFYLVNFFGDVPLTLTTDYKTNALLAKTSKSLVYQQIIQDLKDAEATLSDNYLDGTLHPYSGGSEKVRPTKWAAAALLARTYLYTQAWDSAEAQASLVINNSSLFSLDSLNAAFLANSNEAIWQLQPVDQGYNTWDAQIFIIPSTGFSGGQWPVYLSNSLLNSFEPGDNRKIKWVNTYSDVTGTYYYSFKYKVVNYGDPVSEYIMILRLGEQYLIRAEARAEQNNLNGAENDLNVIRNRAGLPPTTAASQTDVLAAVQRERRVELFSELGHRWLDLKRTASVDSVMTVATPIKSGGSPWQSYQQLYPIPFATDIQKDPNLVQNPGY